MLQHLVGRHRRIDLDAGIVVVFVDWLDRFRLNGQFFRGAGGQQPRNMVVHLIRRNSLRVDRGQWLRKLHLKIPQRRGDTAGLISSVVDFCTTISVRKRRDSRRRSPIHAFENYLIRRHPKNPNGRIQSCLLRRNGTLLSRTRVSLLLIPM